jgi:hypothetical protein
MCVFVRVHFCHTVTVCILFLIFKAGIINVLCTVISYRTEFQFKQGKVYEACKTNM